MIVMPNEPACWQPPPAALFRTMPMTPTRMRECLDQLGWGINQVGRRIGLPGSSAQQMARGTRPIPPHLEAWLEVRAAIWGTLNPELRDLAEKMGCDQGKFARHPVGMRPITDEEAALLQTVATACTTLLLPIGWSERRSPKLYQNDGEEQQE